jgi:hypothetical protein
MEAKVKGKLDGLTVAYGIGASIVITGMMFKFLNWQYANEMLFIGLTTEAIVFFISAFELKKPEKEYKWDKLFPQLTTDQPTGVEQLEEMVQKANVDPMIIERLTNSIEKLENNVHKMSETSNLAHLNEQIDRMRVSSENFEREINRLNKSMSDMSKQYDKVLNVMGGKNLD